jgi:hypothetical protein
MRLMIVVRGRLTGVNSVSVFGVLLELRVDRLGKRKHLAQNLRSIGKERRRERGRDGAEQHHGERDAGGETKMPAGHDYHEKFNVAPRDDDLKIGEGSDARVGSPGNTIRVRQSRIAHAQLSGHHPSAA